MTATPNNEAAGVAARQAWYEREIASAESHWIDTLQERFEDGDEVPDMAQFVALWLAERTPAPSARDADGEVAAWALFDPMGGKPEILTCKGRPYSLDNWQPLYCNPPASVPVAELVALAEKWKKGASLCGTHEYSEGARDALNECADELTALAQKGDARGQG